MLIKKNRQMRTLISIYFSLFLLLFANNKLSAQIPILSDLALNISKMQEQQALSDAEIFKAYGTLPYVPTKIDPTYTLPVAKEKLDLYMRQWVFAFFGPAYKQYKDEVAYRNEVTKQSFKQIKNIVVTDDFLQFTNKKPTQSSDTVTIYFKDILARKIEYFTPMRNGVSEYKRVGENYFRCTIRELPDIFYYIQQYYSLQYYPILLAEFKATADQYQLLTVKPSLSEEQRKYFLQANHLAETGDFYQAMERYEKGISINPISYPSAYYNLALIAATAESYSYAFYCMKKYLLLLPNASDAQTAQDKLYEWELYIK